MSIEVVYTGDYKTEKLPFYDVIRQYFCETVFPHLNWMSSLKSLVLIGSGAPFYIFRRFRNLSRMTYDLLIWLFFDDERAPRTLQHLWIEGFHFAPAPFESIHCHPPLTSHQISSSHVIYQLPEDEILELSRFPKLEFIANTEFSEKYLLLHSPSLKYAHGELQTGDEQVR